MNIEILADADEVARSAAAFIAAEARDAVAARRSFAFAVSGGLTPIPMLRELSTLAVPWSSVHLFQVDERVAPRGDPDRNLTQLDESLLSRVMLPADHVHAMPVEAPNLALAAARYARELESLAGVPPVLDLVHLGLGPDGHTASLVPGDPVLSETGASVALSSPYQGHSRMTLTFPVLDRAHCVLWLVIGSKSAAMLARLARSDRSIPAGRVASERAIVMADVAAAAELD